MNTYLYCLLILLLSILLPLQGDASDADSRNRPPSLLKLQIILIGKGDDYELKIDKGNTAYYSHPERHGPRIDAALSTLEKRIKTSQIVVILHCHGGSEEEIFKRIAKTRGFLKPRIFFAEMGPNDPDARSEVVLWRSKATRGNLFVVGGVQYRRVQDAVKYLRSERVRFVAVVGFGTIDADSEPPADLRRELDKAKINVLKITSRLKIWDGRGG